MHKAFYFFYDVVKNRLFLANLGRIFFQKLYRPLSMSKGLHPRSQI